MEKIKVGGVMQSDGRSLIRVMDVPSEPSKAAVLMGSLSRNGVNVELVVQSVDQSGRSQYGLVVARKDRDLSLNLIHDLLTELETNHITHLDDVAVVSVFGPHLREKPLVPGYMFSALAEADVRALAIATSISSVSCVIEGQLLDKAVTALLTVFDAPFQVKKRPDNY
jgi:aspartate kinase